MDLEKYWSGKKVLITGASSGLGASLVEALAPYRIQFCLLSRRMEPMQDLASRLARSGSTFWIRSCDVQQRNEVEAVIAEFVKEAGRLDVAWINSGTVSDTSFPRWDWPAAEKVIDTNLKGALY